MASHHRDQYISFDEPTHRYTITHPDWLKKQADGTGTISVTTLIHQLFPKFDGLTIATRIVQGIRSKNSGTKLGGYTETELKYLNMTVEEILEAWEVNRVQASSLGTGFHKNVEDFLNSGGIQIPPTITTEFNYFLKFWKDLTTRYPTISLYRTEWIVYDEVIGLAGSIDCVLKDANGNLLILDWKRSKEIKLSNNFKKGLSVFSNFDDCNWSHYQLQLNLYREILERHYQGKIVYMMNVVCHPDQADYLCYPVPHIDISGVWSQLTMLAKQQEH